MTEWKGLENVLKEAIKEAATIEEATQAAALELAKSYLEEGQTTVGAEIHCRHLAPTPVGMKVTATAKLRSIERRKMWFDIEVNDEKGKCGEGSHLRIMVNSKAMSDKAASKAE